MCFTSVVRFTWRIILLLYSSVAICISFVFGPMQTVFYLLGYRPELVEYLKNEIHYAILLFFIMGLCWVIFIANLLLFCACYSLKVLLLEVYVYLMIGKMIASGVVGVKYLIHCWFIDNYCLDHSPRVDEDIGSAIIIFLASFCYILVGLVTVFAVISFKLTFKTHGDDSLQ